MRIDDWAGPRWRRAAGAALVAVCVAGCAAPRDAIVVRDGMLVLENQTAREWRNVRVTINDHFSGGVAKLLPGALMTAPLRNFRSGFGHPFEPWRMSVQKVRVTATGADGKPVALAWGDNTTLGERP